jgi:hypothetical protein
MLTTKFNIVFTLDSLCLDEIKKARFSERKSSLSYAKQAT